MAEGINGNLDQSLGDFQRDTVAGVGDVVKAVWLWLAVFAHVHENKLLDSQDGFLSEDIANLSAQSD